MAKNARTKRAANSSGAKSYRHPEAESPMRPDVGTQPQFKKKKPPQTYRYDSSLSPALDWDGQNPAREQGEALIREILDAPSLDPAKAAAARLKALGSPFLNWAGKAERVSFTVPTLPLFVHERLSTKAIIETLKGHKRDRQETLFDLFGDPQHSVTDQVLRAYEHKDNWVNRLILGDSLVVMNSLLHYEGLGGQVQMIYMDPPYGVRFGSNFQPFVRQRDVKHNDDIQMTREPEMVQAFRDTWKLGIHSYLTYLRDRLLLCRDLLHPSGSIFVQISDENLHHVREVMAEVFGAENFCAVTTFLKTTGASSPMAKTNVLASVGDYVLWYAKDVAHVKCRQLYAERTVDDDYNLRWVEMRDGSRRRFSTAADVKAAAEAGGRVFRPNPLTSQTPGGSTTYSYEFAGRTFSPGKRGWSTHEEGMRTLEEAHRLIAIGNTLCFVHKCLSG